MPFESESPVEAVKIIFFTDKFDMHILVKDIGSAVKFAEGAVIGDEGFGVSQFGSQGKGHDVKI